MSIQKPFSPWNYKPWWCQPWSILLTGILIIVGSWALVKTVWVTVLIAIPILVWWIYFLVLWPQLIRRISSTEGQGVELDKIGELEELGKKPHT